jgi:undecaprenyl-diphosphatase
MVGAAFVALFWPGRRVPALAIVAALLMGVSRMLVGKHYLSDVLAGLALGIGIVGVTLHGYLLPRWHAVTSTSDT